MYLLDCYTSAALWFPTIVNVYERKKKYELNIMFVSG